MGALEDSNIYGIRVRESATDGSDFSNPPADYRLWFVGEDGGLHLKDSSGTVTDFPAGGGSGIPATIFDAKGDIIAASAADTAAKLTAGANDTVLVAASGETTGLKWSAFSGCRVRAVADVALTSGAVVYLLFDTEDFDTDAYHDTGSNTTRLVAPTTGTYMMGGGAFTTSNPGNSYCVIRFNGTTLIASGAFAPQANVGSSMVSTIYQLTAGQYVEFGIQVGASSKSAIDAGVVDPSFWMFKLR